MEADGGEEMRRLSNDQKHLPYIAGRTNGSEYEVLTGNSQSLINDSSPFNNLDLENCILPDKMW